MTGPPSVSMIVPTRDRARSLEDCLAAIAQLDYPASRVEVIVVDDGSNAPLGPVVARSLHGREAILLRQDHAGPAAARNAGAARAGGSLLAFVDDDVLVERGWAKAIAAAAQSRPRTAIGGRTLNSLLANPYTATSERIVELAYAHYNGGPMGPRFFAANNLAVPAGEFRAINGFNATFRTSEDREFCDRWLESGRPMAYEPGAVARHAHPLTLRSFWRQQSGYGRGAFEYHRARARRGRRVIGFEGSFYRRIAREAASSLRRGDPRRAVLLGVWQLANLAGFWEAALQHKANLRARR